MTTIKIARRSDLSIIDELDCCEWTDNREISYGGKKEIVVARKPNIETGDFIIGWKDGGLIFQGVCESVENKDGGEQHTINALEMATLFNENIQLVNESTARTSVEKFIKNTITANFISSADTFTNMGYITVNAITDTPVLTVYEADNGVFNLMAYLSQALELYGVFITFKFVGRGLIIDIEKRAQNLLQIDATLPDITEYKETYKLDVLAKLKVIWKKPDTTTNEITTIGATQVLNYVLLSDQSISTNLNHSDRAKGKADAIFIEKEDSNEMHEEVVNKFKANAYDHSVEADIYTQSLIYTTDELYIGHECLIKTESRGIQKSIITAIEKKNDSEFWGLKFGNMPLTLIEKIRKGVV